MALIVEDGTVVADADSYLSVDDADTYFANRGVSTWALLNTSEKEQALRRATDYMLARYRGRWKGAKVRYEQSLDWPRVGVSPDDAESAMSFTSGYAYQYVLPYTSVPKEVKNACAEFALRAAAGPLLEDQQPQVIQETVGPITTKYNPNSPQVVRYTQLDMILGPLLSGGTGACIKLRRS